MGDRPADLERAIASVRAQQGVDTDVVVVGNGAEITAPGADVVSVLEKNMGIPGGRNHGVSESRGELICFLDDDATLVGNDG